MAITGIMRIGDVGLRVMDMEAALHHYVDIIGLKEVMRDTSGRVYLKCWDEHDHHSLILREADTPGLDYAAYKVRDDATLDAFEKRIRAAGAPVENIDAGVHAECGRRLRFRIPSGHWLELYAEKSFIGNGMPLRNPDIEPGDLTGIAPTRLDHVLLFGPDIPKTAKFFVKILGMDLTEQVVDDQGQMMSAFFTCANKPHDIAFIHYPKEGKLHHVSFWLESGAEMLRAGDILGREAVSVDMGPGRHGITRGLTIYFFDPSGNRNEVFSGGYIWYPDRKPLTWDPEGLPKGVSYVDHQLKENFLEVVT